MKKYILSLNNTHDWEGFMTFWRADNNGYCFYLEDAGQYTELKEGYHDGDHAKPFDVKIIEELSETIPFGIRPNTKKVVKNTEENRRVLGVFQQGRTLVRAIVPEVEDKDELPF